MKVFLCIAIAFVAVNGQTYSSKPSYNSPPYQSPSYPVYPKPSYPSYPKPTYPAADYAKPTYHVYPRTYDVPMPYSFTWAVEDDYSYNNYNHQETGDEKGYVTGSYSVDLPDGRKQTVEYKADDYTGYVADVKYEGEAKYPESKPVQYKSAAYPEYRPSYPSSSYQKPSYPSPTYKKDYPTPSYPTYPTPSYPSYPPKYSTRY